MCLSRDFYVFPKQDLFPFPPQNTIGLHLPVFLAVRGHHVPKFWPITCANMMCATSKPNPQTSPMNETPLWTR